VSGLAVHMNLFKKDEHLYGGSLLNRFLIFHQCQDRLMVKTFVPLCKKERQHYLILLGRSGRSICGFVTSGCKAMVGVQFPRKIKINFNIVAKKKSLWFCDFGLQGSGRGLLPEKSQNLYHFNTSDYLLFC